MLMPKVFSIGYHDRVEERGGGVLYCYDCKQANVREWFQRFLCDVKRETA